MRLSWILPTLLLAAILAGCAQQADGPIDEITYGAANGFSARSMSMVLYADGHGVVEERQSGPFNNGTVSTRSFNLSESERQEIWKLAQDAHIFSLNDRYSCSDEWLSSCPTDWSTISVTVKSGNRAKTVSDYASSTRPASFAALAGKLDSVAQANEPPSAKTN